MGAGIVPAAQQIERICCGPTAPSPVISDCVFRDFYNFGVYFDTPAREIIFSDNVIEDGSTGLYVANAGVDVTIDGNAISGVDTAINLSNVGSSVDRAQVSANQITGCSNGLLMNGGYYHVSNNAIDCSGYNLLTYGTVDVSYSGNTIDWSGQGGIAVSGTITQDTTWSPSQSLGQPYVITGNVTVNAGVTLSIEPGTIIKFDPTIYSSYYHYSMTVNGILDAQGTVEDPIYFTSLRDDTVGGDTNGDGVATLPAARIVGVCSD